MRLIVNGNVYEMNKEEMEGILEIARKQVPSGIYAVEKDGICELKKEEIYAEEHLKKEVEEYEQAGFKVFYNGI